MILDKRRDVPIRLKLAIMNGLDPERLARQMPALPYGVAVQTIDRCLDGVAIGFDLLCEIERLLDQLEPIRPAVAPSGAPTRAGSVRAR